MSERKEQPYYHISRSAFGLVRSGQEKLEAWKAAALAFYGEGENEKAQEKGCPRNTFFALLALGWIRGVPGDPSFAADSGNAAHAVAVVRYLLNNYASRPVSHWPTSKQLWEAVRVEQENHLSDKCSIPVAHNGQVDVIRSLWDDIDLDRVQTDIQTRSD